MKEIKTYGAMLLIGILFSICYGYFKYSKLNTFTEVKLDEITNFRTRYKCEYIFKDIKNKRKYSGLYDQYGSPNDIDENLYYLIGYYNNKPNDNYLIINYFSKNKLNIDSLNKCSKPKDFVSFKEYLKRRTL